MKKILAFNGSGREEGYTAKTIDAILDGVPTGCAQIKKYNLAALNLQFCTGCLSCRKQPGCAIQDDMQDIYREMRDVDVIILGIPIYFRQMSGQCKTFIDRLYPLFGPNGLKLGKKKLILVYTQGFSDPEYYREYITATTDVFKLLDMEVVARLLCYGTSSNVAAENTALREEARLLGKQMINF